MSTVPDGFFFVEFKQAPKTGDYRRFTLSHPLSGKTKRGRVGGACEAVDRYARGREVRYQVYKLTMELFRDALYELAGTGWGVLEEENRVRIQLAHWSMAANWRTE